MLFSDEEVAALLNREFEPVWVSLRPVPRVTIDFGYGQIIQRTLHGNIATWICASDGIVLDVLPGIYDAGSYTKSLQKLRSLYQDFHQLTSAADRVSWLRRYHGRWSSRPISSGTGTLKSEATGRTDRGHRLSFSAELQRALTQDTRINESVRRPRIHAHLKDLGLVRPDQIAPWLYREVLDADLDDPWLGLGDALFKDYPFAVEKKTNTERSSSISINR